MSQTVQNQMSLEVPALPKYARTVRMCAANLGVLAQMSVDEVEDFRMAAEEGFVYACATGLSTCSITMSFTPDKATITFELGQEDPTQNEEAFAQDKADISLIELLLQAVCDTFDITSDNTLELVKQIGAANDN